jgi:hypothetical protein
MTFSDQVAANQLGLLHIVFGNNDSHGHVATIGGGLCGVRGAYRFLTSC